MDNITQLVDALNELFTLSDEELNVAKPAILDSLTQSLTGPEATEQIDNYLKQCDLMGYSLTEYNRDIEEGKKVIESILLELKERYQDSEVKVELIDMIASLSETYYTVLALRIANREDINIGIELIHPNAKIPTYAHEGDQGADVYAVEDTIIEPHTFGNVIPTGLKLMIPKGWAIAIRPRSGLSKNTPLRISNSPATIDQLYRGEVKILFDNFSNEPVAIKAGERVAQFVIEKNYRGTFTQVDSVSAETDRGEGGFGSSGN